MSENRKLRVAITQGDANGVGFEMIFKTFLEPEMLSLCTPVIYGSPKVASYHSKALNLHNTFSIISRIEDVHDDRVNLLVSTDEEVKVEFGKHSDDSARVALTSIKKAIVDCQRGLVDVLVCGPTDNRKIVVDGAEKLMDSHVCRLLDGDHQSLRLFQNDVLRMMVVHAGSLKNISSALSKEKMSSTIKSLHATLQRDFRLDNPRIAILALNLVDDVEESEILLPAVRELIESNLQVFGPYKSDQFFGYRGFESFDAIIAMHYEQALLPMRMLTDRGMVVVQTNLPFVCTMPFCDAQIPIGGRGKADEMPLRQAIYAGLDIFRARKDYDEALSNPLQKHYIERSENAERPYFPPIKKTEESDGQL